MCEEYNALYCDLAISVNQILYCFQKFRAGNSCLYSETHCGRFLDLGVFALQIMLDQKPILTAGLIGEKLVFGQSNICRHLPSISNTHQKLSESNHPQYVNMFALLILHLILKLFDRIAMSDRKWVHYKNARCG